VEKVKVKLSHVYANIAALKNCYTDIAVEVDSTGKPSKVDSVIDIAIKEACYKKA